MTEGRGRFGRLTDAVLSGSRTVREKVQEVREDFRTADEPERLLVAPLVPDQQVLYASFGAFALDDFYRLSSQFTDHMGKELAESFDPRELFGLLNIVNPLVWVDAVIAPVRIAAGLLMLPANAAALAAGVGQSAQSPDEPEERPKKQAAPRTPLPLTEEQEAFRALFRLSPYRPLADQLAEIAYQRRYVFSGDLATVAGSLLLFLQRYSGTNVVVTDTHLHLVRMGMRPDPGLTDNRKARLLWSIPRERVARIDCDYRFTRLMVFPMHITFDDGSWLRVLNPAVRADQVRFLAATQGIPGKRPAL